MNINETRHVMGHLPRGCFLRKMPCPLNYRIHTTSLRQLPFSSQSYASHTQNGFLASFNYTRNEEASFGKKYILVVAGALALKEATSPEEKESKQLERELLLVLRKENFAEILAFFEKKGLFFLNESPNSKYILEPYKKSILEDVLESLNYELSEDILIYLFSYLIIHSEQEKKKETNLLHILLRNYNGDKNRTLFNLIKKEISKNPELLRKKANFQTSNMTPVEMSMHNWRSIKLKNYLIYKHQQYFGFTIEEKRRLIAQVESLKKSTSLNIIKEGEILLKKCENLGEKKAVIKRSGTELRRDLAVRVITNSAAYKKIAEHLFEGIFEIVEDHIKEKISISLKKLAYEMILKDYENFVLKSYVEEFYNWLCLEFTNEEIEEMLEEYEYNDGKIETQFHNKRIDAYQVFNTEKVTQIMKKNHDKTQATINQLLLFLIGDEKITSNSFSTRISKA